MKLGGWWRLWIALSVIYGCFVAIYTFNTFPSLEIISHQDEYLLMMSTQAQQIVATEARPLPPPPTAKGLMEFQVYGRGPDVRFLSMPNGFTLSLAGHLTNEQRNIVADEYTRVLRTALPSARLEALLIALLIWLGPVVAPCLLGLTARWISKGFRKLTGRGVR